MVNMDDSKCRLAAGKVEGAYGQYLRSNTESDQSSHSQKTKNRLKIDTIAILMSETVGYGKMGTDKKID